MKKIFLTLFCAGTLFSSGVAQNIIEDGSSTADMHRILHDTLRDTRELVGGIVSTSVIVLIAYNKFILQKKGKIDIFDVFYK